MTLFERTLTTLTMILSGIAMVLMVSAVASANTKQATRNIASTKQVEHVPACDKDVQEFLANELEYLNVTANSDDGMDAATELESQYQCEFKN